MFYLLNKRGLPVRLAKGEWHCPVVFDGSVVDFIPTGG
jgi:hypothetical protein